MRPTKSQRDAIGDLQRDMERQRKQQHRRRRPTVRIILGDVGSGKTHVAAEAIRHCTERIGKQAAYMAPTEALARQQYHTLTHKYGIRDCEIITGPNSTKAARETLHRVQRGQTRVLVGTTGITAAEFRDLLLLVIDEQQKFGVRARNEIADEHPGIVIAMLTATPIPRTTELIRTGHIQASHIRHPTHRKRVGKPICTNREMTEQNTRDEYRKLKGRLSRDAGARAYLVFASVTERGADGSLTPLIDAVQDVCRHAAPKGADQVGILHGKLDKEQQAREMERFENGKTRILMTSSIVEVGIHNDQATDVIIHNAERFGAAQLHQIQGRVGRNPDTAARARCVALHRNTAAATAAGSSSSSSNSRRTRDGWTVALADAQRRGHGTLAGTLQKGTLTDVIRDALAEAQL